MALYEKESSTDFEHNPRPHPGCVAHMPTLHTTTTTTEQCCVLDAGNIGNISGSITTGTEPTGIHRHLEKVTMETLHEGHPEERGGNCITNAGFLPLFRNAAHNCEVLFPPNRPRPISGARTYPAFLGPT
jgi:hypothetical protein